MEYRTVKYKDRYVLATGVPYWFGTDRENITTMCMKGPNLTHRVKLSWPREMPFPASDTPRYRLVLEKVKE